MSDVSVIGTGAMGGALVEVLAASGAAVTVWNRTSEKAEALAGPQVSVAGSAGEALTSSPLTIISVSDHELARAIIDESEADLRDKVVASTSFVDPDQAQTFAATVAQRGGHYLDLAIAAYPSEVRSRSGTLLLSGAPAAYDAHRQLFEQIGRASFVNDTSGAAFISEMAVLLAYLPMAVGLLQGRRICERLDIPLEWFEQTVMDLYPSHIQSLLERVADADPLAHNVEASIDIWGEGAAEYAAYLRELGLDAGMYEALHQLFTAASEGGHGDADWTCVVDHAANSSR